MLVRCEVDACVRRIRCFFISLINEEAKDSGAIRAVAFGAANEETIASATPKLTRPRTTVVGTGRNSNRKAYITVFCTLPRSTKNGDLIAHGRERRDGVGIHDCLEGSFAINYYKEELLSYFNHWTIENHRCCIAGDGCANPDGKGPFSPSHTTPVYICEKYKKRGENQPPNCCRHSHVCHICSQKFLEVRTKRKRTKPKKHGM